MSAVATTTRRAPSRLPSRVMKARRRSNGLAILGVALTVLLCGAVLLVVETFAGAFTDYVPVTAVLAGSGNAVDKGDAVIYRDVPVGSVASSGVTRAHGSVDVPLHLDPYRAREIPANVTATVEPVTIFGTEYVVLNAPAHAVGRLAAGDHVASAPPTPGANVQGAVTSLDSILNALHPAQLDTALTAIATALQGQGKGIGQTLVSIDRYLKTMLPHLPLMEADLGLLAPLANQVAASAPQLVGSLSNLAVPSRALTADASELGQSVAGGASVAHQLYALLQPIQSSFEETLEAAGPFFADLSQSPTEVARIVVGLEDWAKSWATAESSGPYLSFSSSVPIANATDLVFAALNAPGTAGPSGLGAQALGTVHVDPPTYSSRATPLAASDVQVDPAILTAAEVQAASQVAAGLDGGRPPASAAVSALYMAPLLNALVVG